MLSDEPGVTNGGSHECFQWAEIRDAVTLPYEPNPGDPEISFVEEGSSELVRRLRNLRWPEVSPEVRQRSWELLRAEVSALANPPQPVPTGEAHSPGSAETPSRNDWRDRFGRLRERHLRNHDFARRASQGVYTGALGHRLNAARRAVTPPVR